jgi:ribosomal protein L20A (L18A)
MKVFKVVGEFNKGRLKNHPFTKEIKAADDAAAAEKVLAIIGSLHKCPRRYVKIDKIEEKK